MGNTACLSESEAKAVSSSELAKTQEEDEFCLALLQQRLPTNSLGRIPALDHYQARGLGFPPGSPCHPELQELALVCLQHKGKGLFAKQTDVQTALMSEIKYLAGTESSAEEQFNKARVLVLCRVYDALRREEERERRRIAPHTLREGGKSGKELPPLGKLGVSFGIGMLVALVETVGEEKSELLRRVVDVAADLVPDMKPLSLCSPGDSVSRSLLSVTSLFNRVLSGQFSAVRPSCLLKSLCVSLALALATANLASVISATQRLLLLPRSSDWTEALASLMPLLKELSQMSAKSLAVEWTWNTTRLGPDMVLSNANRTVTRGSATGWGCHLSEQTVTSGVHYIEFLIERNTSTCLLVGIAAKSYEAYSSKCTQSDVICYQSDGDTYCQGSGSGNIGSYSAGDRIGLLLDMEDHSLIFLKNGLRMPREPLRPVPDEVALIVCLGGSDQFITLSPSPHIPPEFEDIVNLVPASRPLPSEESSFFPTNVHVILQTPHFSPFSPSNSAPQYEEIEGAAVAAFVLSRLEVLSEGLFAVFQLDNIKPKYPKHTPLTRNFGLAVDVSPATFQALLQALDTGYSLLQETEADSARLELLVWAVISCLRILRNHVFAARTLGLPSQLSGLTVPVVDRIKALLAQFSAIGSSNEAFEALSKIAVLVTIHCFDLFYPTPFNQLHFVVSNLQKTEELTEGEKKLLSEVIKKVTLPVNMYRAVASQSDSALKAVLLQLIDQATEQSVACAKGVGRLEEGVFSLLYMALSMILAEMGRKGREDLGEVCLEVLKRAEEVAGVLWESSGGKPTEAQVFRLKRSLLGSHLMLVLRGMSLLRFSVDFSSELILQVLRLSTLLASFSSGRPESLLGISTVKQVFESAHPYPDNADMDYRVEVAGAVFYTLEFDPQCKSERNFDYLELWTDEEKTTRLFRWQGDSWPQGPLTIKQPSLFFSFHSDQSSSFWGWKIAISARVLVPMLGDSFIEELRSCTTLLQVSLCQGLISLPSAAVCSNLAVESVLRSKLLRAGVKDIGIHRISGCQSVVSPALEALVTGTQVEEKLPAGLSGAGLMKLTVFKSLLPKRLVTKPNIADYLHTVRRADSPSSRYCDDPFLDEFVSGSDRTMSLFAELKRQAKVSDPVASMGDAHLDQAERALFSVFAAFFDIAELLSALLERPREIGEMLKYLVKETCGIRQWAQIHRLKVINETNTELSYEVLGRNIVSKCVLLLNTDYKQTMAEMGIDKAVESLKSAFQRPKLDDSPVKSPYPGTVLRSGSKWMAVKKAVATMKRLKTLQELRNLGRPREQEGEDKEQFRRVASLVLDLLASAAPLDEVVREVGRRRDVAVARTAGLQVLSNIARVAPLPSKGETQGVVTGAFSEAFLVAGRKTHFTEGTAGVDPYLRACLRRYFFQIYQMLLERLQVSVLSELDCTSSAVFPYLMHTLEALNFPFEDQDAYSLLDLRIRQTVDLLLSWAKGQRIYQHIPLQFDSSRAITDLKVHNEAEYRSGRGPKEAFSLNIRNRLDGEVAEEIPGQRKLALEVIRGGSEAITEIYTCTSPNAPPGYLLIASNINEVGAPLALCMKRERPQEGGHYLASLAVTAYNPVQLTCKYLPYSHFLRESSEDQTQRQARKVVLKRGAWLLFKLLAYTAAGKGEDQQSVTKQNSRLRLQELFMELVFGKMKWLPLLGEREERLGLRKLLSGRNWRSSEIPLIELKTNPVVEWIERIRQDAHEFLYRAAAAGEEARPFEVSLMDNVSDYISSTDPCLQGVLETQDVPEGVEDIPEEYYNSKKQVDFFCFLRHIVAHIDSAVSPFWAKNVKSSPLYQNMPMDYYEAKERCGEGNVASILKVFQAALTSTDSSFTRYLELFSSSEVPGVVPAHKIPENTPSEFLNDDQQLDFFTTMKAIRENEGRFQDYWRELKPLMRPYEELPASCGEFYKVRLSASQMEYQASLLLVVYQCCSFQGLQKVLSKSAHLLELLKHMLMGSLKASTIAFRIVREVLSSQHSPESFAGIWSSLPKGRLIAEFGSEATKDFVTTLWTFIGEESLKHAKTWKQGVVSAGMMRTRAHEALELLLLLCKKERWSRHVMTTCLKVLSHCPPEAGYSALVGALVFLNSSNAYRYSFPREWSKVELQGAGVSQGTLVKCVEGEDSVKVYCEADDALHTERKETVVGSLCGLSFPYLLQLPADLLPCLFTALISLLVALRTDSCLPTLPAPYTYIRAVERTVQCSIYTALATILDSKEDLPSDFIPSLTASLLPFLSSDALPDHPQLRRSLLQLLFHRNQGQITSLLQSLQLSSQATAIYTEEAEARIIGKYSEELQMLVAMLKSLGLAFGAIMQAIDEGCGDLTAVLQRLEDRVEGKETSRELPPLYKLTKSDKSPAYLYDRTGCASGRDTGHLVLTAWATPPVRTELLKHLDDSLFCSEDNFPAELTILAALGCQGHPAPVFGLCLGDFHLSVQASSSPKYEFRLYVKLGGAVEAVTYPEGEPVAKGNIGFGLEQIADIRFGVYIETQGVAELQGFAVFVGHYEGCPAYWKEEKEETIQQAFGSLVDYSLRLPNRTEVALKSVLGVKEGKAGCRDLKDALSQLELGDLQPLESNYGEYIQDCLVLASQDQAIPPEYTLVPVFEGEERIQDASSFLAVRKSSAAKGSGCYVKGLVWADGQVQVLYEEKSLAAPLVGLAVLRTVNPQALSLPLGYRLLTHLNKAVNVTPNTAFCHFVAYSTCYSVRNFPFIDLCQMPKRQSNEGLIDSFPRPASHLDPRKTSEELGRLAGLSTVQLQCRLANLERREQATAALQVLVKLVARWGLADAALLQQLLEKSGDMYRLLEPIISQISQHTDIKLQRTVWLDTVTQLCHGSLSVLEPETRTRSLTFESSHPYENNLDHREEIHLPGARKLVFSFDQQCRTETNFDYLVIGRDEGLEDQVAKMTGTRWTEVEMDGDTAYVLFHSDVSNNEWGYKFTVTGYLAGDEETEQGVKRSLWLLERLFSPSTPLPPRLFLGPALLYALTLFAHTTSDAEQSLRAMQVLKQLVKTEAGQTNAAKEVLSLLLRETLDLFAEEVARPRKSTLLITVTNLLAEFREAHELSSNSEWFNTFYENYSFLKGFVDKNEDFQYALLKQFLAERGKSLDLVRESAHPYSTTLTSREAHIQGADFITITLTPDSLSCPSHSVLFTSDLAAAQPFLLGGLSSPSQVLWSRLLKGPDIVLSEGERRVTRTSSSGWGCAVLDKVFRRGKVKVTFRVETHDDSSYLYLGVVQEGAFALDSCVNKDFTQPSWTYKATGEFHRKGFSVDQPSSRYTTNDEVTLHLDFNQHTLSFYKNRERQYTFTDLTGAVTAVGCFGGAGQSVSLLSVEVEQLDPTRLSEYHVVVPGDRFYYHFPVNIGYVHYLYAQWKDDKQPNVLFSSVKPGFVRLPGPQDPITVYTQGVMRAGRHLLELKVTTLAPNSALSLGIIPLGISDFLLSYSSIGRLQTSERDLSLVGFSAGDVVGLLLGMEQGELRVYRNGELVSQALRVTVETGREYRWAVQVEGSAEVEIVKDSPLVKTVDLFGRSNTQGSVTDHYGYKFTAVPTYLGRNKRLVLQSLGPLEPEWQSYYKAQKSLISSEVCEQLVSYLDEKTGPADQDPVTLQAEEIAPSAQELLHFPLLESLSLSELRSLFLLIKDLNLRASSLLPLISLQLTEDTSSLSEVQRLFLAIRGSLFLRRKKAVLRDYLERTSTSERPVIEVNRTRAARQKEKGMVDTQGVSSIFGQIYRRINQLSNRSLRNSDRIFQVNFLGEGAIDAGGPYNEVMSAVCEELQSPYLPLLVQCANGIHNLGNNRDAWLPSPCSKPHHLSMFLFLGKLLGVAIRTNLPLNLSLAPFFWKRLIFDPLTSLDIKSFDECLYQTLDVHRHLEEQGINSDNFDLAFGGETFTTVDSGGRVVELKPGGRGISVTVRNAGEYADLLESQRLHEAAEAYSALRQGLSAVIPLHCLYLFSWKQVETLVCGAADISVDLLRSNAIYVGYEPDSDIIHGFWRVLSEFSPKERSLFLRFVWGRSKLPAGKEFKRFQITYKAVSGPADQYLPVSHTCFFTLDLPEYTSEDVTREKLMYAITHCQAIDLDKVAGAEGWDED